MSDIPDSLLIQYQCDALDRLVSCMPRGQLRQDRHYQEGRLTTEIQGALQRQIFRGMNVLLAENHKQGTQHTSLLMTDKQGSVLQSSDGQSAYTPYGHRTVQGGLTSLLAFNGERRDTSTGHYLLGNGHRAFNPVLMRFNSPDSLSPFGKGGLNCYAYCGGEPINRIDPTGRAWYGWAWFANGALGMVDDYLIPLLPRSLARHLPSVANPTFGKVTKSMANVGGFSASALYLVMNRVEAYYPLSSVNDSIFYAFLTTSAFTVVNSAAHTLHKLSLRQTLPLLPSTSPVLKRTASAPDLRSVSITVSDLFNPRLPLQQTSSRTEAGVSRSATSIRQAI